MGRWSGTGECLMSWRGYINSAPLSLVLSLSISSLHVFYCVALVFLLLLFLSFFFSPSMCALTKFEYAIWNFITSLVVITVLIFFLPSEALRRHLLSVGSKVSGFPFLGTGFVLPSYFFKVMTTLPLVRHFWKSRVSSVRNASFSNNTMFCEWSISTLMVRTRRSQLR